MVSSEKNHLNICMKTAWTQVCLWTCEINQQTCVQAVFLYIFISSFHHLHFVPIMLQFNN